MELKINTFSFAYKIKVFNSPDLSSTSFGLNSRLGNVSRNIFRSSNDVSIILTSLVAF